MSKELVLQTKDLQSVGITSQLTSNDLLEVVANDIFEKVMDEINDCIRAEKELRTKVQRVMNPEHEEMRAELVKNKFLAPNEEVNTGFSKVDGWDWSSIIYGLGFDLTEKDKGTKIELDKDAIRYSYPTGKTAKVKLKISVDEREEENKNAVNGITVKINTTTSKSFEKIVTISTARFKDLLNEIKAHNKRMEQVNDMLPSSGLISVERFTREARIKMNKKILSSQPEEFRKKISQLFNIKL